MAAINDQLATAESLIRHGATIDVQDNAQKTPLLLSINNGIYYTSPLQNSMKNITLRVSSTVYSICHFFRVGNSDIADLLIKNGATIKNLDQYVIDGKPILHWAAEKGNLFITISKK